MTSAQTTTDLPADTEPPHGDPLRKTPAQPVAASDKPIPGDSPKPHGDALKGAVDDAAKE